MADAIVSLEYYLETLKKGRADPWYMLDNAESCMQALRRVDELPEFDTGEINRPASPGFIRQA